MSTLYYESSISHHGILGMKWGVRRYQDKHGRLTKAGKKHLQQHLQQATDGMRAEVQKPGIFDNVDRANARVAKSLEPMNKFLDDQKLSDRYIRRWLKGSYQYKEEPDYAMHEVRFSMKHGWYDDGPYKMYAEEHGINYKKLASECHSAHSEMFDAYNKFADDLIAKYGDTTVEPGEYSPFNHRLTMFAGMLREEHEENSK